MLIAMVAITAMAVSAVIAATALVSLASVWEDTRWTLGKPATGRIQTAARRILSYHSDATRRPVARRCARTQARLPGPDREGTPDSALPITGQAAGDHDYAQCS
jgi:hypothetical protein